MEHRFLAQVVGGAQTVKNLTDSVWDKPPAWWVAAFLILLCIVVGIIIWYLMRHSGRLEDALDEATEDRVKLAGSSATAISDVKAALDKHNTQMMHLVSVVNKIWEYLLKGGDE